jgi:hypothetical protein
MCRDGTPRRTLLFSAGGTYLNVEAERDPFIGEIIEEILVLTGISPVMLFLLALIGLSSIVIFAIFFGIGVYVRLNPQYAHFTVSATSESDLALMLLGLVQTEKVKPSKIQDINSRLAALPGKYYLIVGAENISVIGNEK